jgi:cytochrome c biogenesis protein CcmG, thiol:disulfide interchange protein DsbE
VRRLGAGLLLVVLLVVAAACGGDDDSSASRATAASGAPGASGAPAASTPAGVTSTDKEDWALPKLTGDGQVRLADYRGTPVVVNFFASWCEPCKRELPAFHAVSTALKGKVTFIGVNSNDSGHGLPLAESTGITDWPLARDQGGRSEDGLARALRSPGLPTTAFYDANGKLVGQTYAETSEAELKAKIHDLYGISVP